MLDPIVATLKDRIDADPRSHKELAGEMFISSSYLYDILAGKRQPRLSMLRQLLAHFDLDVTTEPKSKYEVNFATNLSTADMEKFRAEFERMTGAHARWA